jgi:hypothetical protein
MNMVGITEAVPPVLFNFPKLDKLIALVRAEQKVMVEFRFWNCRGHVLPHRRKTGAKLQPRPRNLACSILGSPQHLHAAEDLV